MSYTPSKTEIADAPRGVETSYAISAGEYFRGQISSSNDHDYIAISLEAGQTYTFAMVGTGALTQGLSDPYLRLRDSTGARLAYDDNGGPGQNSVITFTATYAGTYYLDAGSGGNGSGEYTLSAVEGTRASFDTAMIAGALLRRDSSWAASAAAPVTVTWGFRDTAPYTDRRRNPVAHDADGENTPFFQLTAEQQAAVQSALDYYSEITGITFVQVSPGATTNDATILFGAYSSLTDGVDGFAYSPGSTSSTSTAGDVWLNNNSVSASSLSAGSFSYATILQQIGVALGLSQPGDYAGDAPDSISYLTDAQFLQDSDQFAVMSGFDESNTMPSMGSDPQTAMLADIYALQSLYGANHMTRSGDTVYGFNSNAGGLYDFANNSAPFLSLWDGGGNDTFDLSGFAQDQLLDLREGRFSSIGGYSNNVSIAYGAEIENAIGGIGNDSIFGNELSNTVDGDAGNDSIDGGDGNDTLYGGAGNDALYGGAGEDAFYAGSGDDLLNGGDGVDTVSFAGAGNAVNVSLTIAGAQNTGEGFDTFSTIENVIGTGFDDSLTGDANSNILSGELGNDLLSGGLGDDVLDGGAGIDTASYETGNGVTVSLAISGPQATGEGSDTLVSIENLIGSAFGDALTGDGAANVVGGGDGADIIDGGAGNDTLSGEFGNDVLSGGLGDDALDGGAGNDTASYANAANGVTVSLAIAGTQSTGDGNDTLVSIESLIGSAFGDVLTGDGSGSALSGGAGNDLISGGSGDDLVDGGADTDTASYANAANGVNVSLAITGAQATGDGSDTLVSIENLVGSGFNDVLTGDGSNNVLSGGDGFDTLFGGNGNDALDAGASASRANWQYLYGGAGDDAYAISHAGHDYYVASAAETGGGGNDRLIFSDIPLSDITASFVAIPSESNALQLNWGSGGTGGSVRVALGGQYIESYQFSDGATINVFAAGTGAGETLSGGALNDYLDGGAGNDTVDGGNGEDWLRGGAGFDTLNGGNGNDVLNADASDSRANWQYLLGGAGNDTYMISRAGHDHYVNSSSENAAGGTDRMVFSDIRYADVTVTYVDLAEGRAVQLNWGSGANGGSVRVALQGQYVESYQFSDGVTIANFMQNAVTGGGSNDTLSSTIGYDAFNGDAGTDIASYQNASAGVTASLANQIVNRGAANGDTYASVEGLEGSNFDDFLHGDANANTLLGGAGFDTLYGGAGNDILDAGAVADRSRWQYLLGGAGDDIYLISRAGRDQFVYTNSEDASGGNDRIILTDVNYSDASVTYVGSGASRMLQIGWNGLGPAGGTVRVAADGQYVESYEFADGVVINSFLEGTSSGETLSGGSLNDYIRGQGGNDTIRGGAGADILTGGTGNDLFVFDTADFAAGVNDAIADFHEAASDTDILRLQGSAANYGFANSGSNLLVTQTATGGTITIANFSTAQLDAGQVQYF